MFVVVYVQPGNSLGSIVTCICLRLIKYLSIIGGVNLSQNAVPKKILKILRAVKTSGLTNLHIVYLTTPKFLDSQKKQIW